MTTAYVFCPEKGVSVAMLHVDEALNREKNPSKIYQVILAVTFCQERVPFSRDEARKTLNKRLEETCFTDYFGLTASSNPFVTILKNQKSDRPQKDILLPFLRYILKLQSTYQNRLKKLIGKPIINNLGSNCPKKPQTKYYTNPITAFSIEFSRKKFEPSNSLIEAQKKSVIGVAVIKLNRIGDVIWSKDQKLPRYRVHNTYKETSQNFANRIKKLEGWEPLFQPYLEKEKTDEPRKTSKKKQNQPVVLPAASF